MVALALVPGTAEDIDLEAVLVSQIENGFRFNELIEAPLSAESLVAMGDLLARMTVIHDNLKRVAAT